MPRPRTVSDEQILQATTQAISRVGPAHLTLADVASQVGLSPATLVQRFGTKRRLLLALAAQGPRQVEQALARPVEDGASPLSVLVQTLTMVPAHLADPGTMANHLAFLQLDLSDPEFGAYAAAHARAFRRGVQALLEVAVDRGELVPVDTARLARALQVTYNGALVSWAIEPETALAAHLESELAFALGPWRTLANPSTRHESHL